MRRLVYEFTLNNVFINLTGHLAKYLVGYECVKAHSHIDWYQ